ncbi:MAG: undecaprenyl-phosphate galactose phosphotransferase WbaP [bacterium]
MQTTAQESVRVLDSIVSIPRPAKFVPQNGAKPRETGRRYTMQVLLTSAPLVVADALALVGSTLLAYTFVNSFWRPIFVPDFASLLLLFAGAFLTICAILELYPGTGLNPIIELRRTCIATTLLFAIFFAASLVYDRKHAFVSLLTTAYLLSILFVPLLRSFARSIFSRFRWWGQPVLIVGGITSKAAVCRHLVAHPRLGLRPIEIIDDIKSLWKNGTLDASAVFGPLNGASEITHRDSVFWVIVALPEYSPTEVLHIIKTHGSKFPHVLIVPDLDGLPTIWDHAQDWGGLPGIRIETSLLMPLPRLLKRAMDLLILIVSGIYTVPLLAIIALLIKLSSSGPIIYGQERIGLGGRRFRAWKFRTMMVDADKVLERYLAADPRLRKEWEKNYKLRNDPRVTRIGRWLRMTSLDELPQLWNVLHGEMSLVGPRPIVEAEIHRYGESFDLYTKVLPGITGLWQISGRNNLPYPERVRLDSDYVRNWSPWMDLYILARTVKVVLEGEGAY